MAEYSFMTPPTAKVAQLEAPAQKNSLGDVRVSADELMEQENAANDNSPMLAFYKEGETRAFKQLADANAELADKKAQKLAVEHKLTGTAELKEVMFIPKLQKAMNFLELEAAKECFGDKIGEIGTAALKFAAAMHSAREMTDARVRELMREQDNLTKEIKAAETEVDQKKRVHQFAQQAVVNFKTMSAGIVQAPAAAAQADSGSGDPTKPVVGAKRPRTSTLIQKSKALYRAYEHIAPALLASFPELEGAFPSGKRAPQCFHTVAQQLIVEYFAEEAEGAGGAAPTGAQPPEVPSISAVKRCFNKFVGKPPGKAGGGAGHASSSHRSKKQARGKQRYSSDEEEEFDSDQPETDAEEEEEEYLYPGEAPMSMMSEGAEQQGNAPAGEPAEGPEEEADFGDIVVKEEKDGAWGSLQAVAAAAMME